MKNQEKITKFLNKTKNPYILKVEDILVEFEYLDVGKTFDECIINVLKERSQKH